MTKHRQDAERAHRRRYKIVTYTNGTLLLQKGSDLRLFYLTVYREGGDPTNGRIEVSFAGKVP